ncbi:hypothetical protein QCA50_006338 [Cerrena zonata]|uniref:DUF6535 domain-containing protein n=1 Tax=Cerrena zonata TaxID=2478898 RepID=A0AAW0GJ41_9APHY
MEDLRRGSPSPPLISDRKYGVEQEDPDPLSPSMTLQEEDFDDELTSDWEPPESPPNSREGWSKVSKVLREYDDHKIKVVKEDIDTLLVFAGLFSAVLTAFVIESYQKLEEDSGDVSSRLLLQISQQLTSFTLSPGFVNATIPSISALPAFKPNPSMVRINGLWFCSLICSLVTASLGILVKQWLHEYMSHDSLSPRAHVRIRQFRYEGLIRWRVFEIAAALPLLVQVALVLFFIGLSEFLRELNPTIGWIVSSLILAWAAIFITANVASAFSSQCPYKSRMLKGAMQRIRPVLVVGLNCLLYGPVRLLQPVSRITRAIPAACSKAIPSFSSSCTFIQSASHRISRSLSKWYNASVVYLVDVTGPREEKEVRGDVSYDMPYLASADALFLDDDFLEPVGECLRDAELVDALPCIRQIISYRCDITLTTLEDLPLHWSTMGQMSRAGTLCLQRTMVDLINQEVDRVMSFHGEFGPSEWTAEIAEAVFFVIAADFLFVEQENVRELFCHLLGLSAVTARGVLEALCKHPSYNPAPQVPYTEFLPNILTAAHQLLDRYIIDDAPDTNNDADNESIISTGDLLDNRSVEPIKLCMIVLSLVDQVPVPDIWTYGEDFLDLQSRFAAAIRNDLVTDKPMPWARRTPTWSMNILRYLQHHVPEFVDEELIEALDAAADKQEGARQRIVQSSVL